MNELIKKIVYMLLALQEKFARRKHEKMLKKLQKTTSKTVLTGSCSLNFSAKTEENKIKLENNIKSILKKYENMPEKILVYIEKNGTPVVRRKNAEKVLDIIREEQGYLRELSGLKAFVLNLLLFKKVSFKSNAMFLLNEGEIDKYAMIHQFYKWYAMKLNMPGFDSQSQENFRKYIDEKSYLNLDNLDIEDIIGLKEAIARDVDAIDFVQNLAQQTEGSKNALKKLTDGGTSV
ncbi:MAG: hypothetical protein ACI37S_08240 [Candidatus Gastranaerophilaceae bacterium]